MFLFDINDQNTQLFLYSIGFCIVVILLWLCVYLTVKAIKNKKTNKTDVLEKSSDIDNTNNEPEAQESKESPVQEDASGKEQEPVKEADQEITQETQAAEENVEAEAEAVTKDSVQEPTQESPIEENTTEQEPQEEAQAQESVDVDNPTDDAVAQEETEASEEKAEEIIVEAAPIEEKQEPQEEAKPKKQRTYTGKYEVFPVADGYAYQLKASNGEILVISETYKSRDGVIKAIDAVKRNLEAGEVKIFEDKRGNFKFKLISKNYRVLAISSNYSLEKSAVRASESFKKFALKAVVVDVDLVDADAKQASIIEITTTEDKPGGKYVVEKYDGEFSWALKASNGQILCQAEGFTSKAGCQYSIDMVKRNIKEGTFKCIKDKSGHYCYKLYTPNGRICAIGESYNSKEAAISAANSVVSFYNLAEIVEEK